MAATLAQEQPGPQAAAGLQPLLVLLARLVLALQALLAPTAPMAPMALVCQVMIGVLALL